MARVSASLPVKWAGVASPVIGAGHWSCAGFIESSHICTDVVPTMTDHIYFLPPPILILRLGGQGSPDREVGRVVPGEEQPLRRPSVLGSSTLFEGCLGMGCSYRVRRVSGGLE